MEYKQRFLSERPIYCLTNNKVERLKVCLIKQSLDNRIYDSNPRNADFDDLSFDGDESLITKLLIYCIHDDILFSLINGPIFCV